MIPVAGVPRRQQHGQGRAAQTPRVSTQGEGSGPESVHVRLKNQSLGTLLGLVKELVIIVDTDIY